MIPRRAPPGALAIAAMVSSNNSANGGRVSGVGFRGRRGTDFTTLEPPRGEVGRAEVGLGGFCQAGWLQFRVPSQESVLVEALGDKVDDFVWPFGRGLHRLL